MVAMGRSPLSGPRLVRTTRPALNGALSMFSPVPPETQTTLVRTTTRHGQVRGEWVHESGKFGGRIPEASTGRSILYYLHGSGFLACSARTHRGMVARLIRRSGIGAFTLEYRLGPIHRFPAGGDDAIRGYRWLLDRGYTGDQIIIAGDSAGGHLAQDLIAANHRDGVPQPRAMVLFSPLYDPSFEIACEYERTGIRDPHIDAAAAARLLKMYTAGAPTDHPRMRIAMTEDMDLPDALIQYGAREVMGRDSQIIHQNLLDAGGNSTLQAWAGQGHVFQMFPNLGPDGREATRQARDFIDPFLR